RMIERGDGERNVTCFAVRIDVVIVRAMIMAGEALRHDRPLGDGHALCAVRRVARRARDLPALLLADARMCGVREVQIVWLLRRAAPLDARLLRAIVTACALRRFRVELRAIPRRYAL